MSKTGAPRSDGRTARVILLLVSPIWAALTVELVGSLHYPPNGPINVGRARDVLVYLTVAAVMASPILVWVGFHVLDSVRFRWGGGADKSATLRLLLTVSLLVSIFSWMWS